MIDRVLGAVGWFISGGFGAFLGYLYAQRLALRRQAVADAAARHAHLENLREELTANQQILEEMSTHVNGGPPILEILEPADVAAAHLRFTAWDALIRAGVLANLTPTEQALFRVADRAGRKAAQTIHTASATWRRFLPWQEWIRVQKKNGKLIQEWPTDGMLRQVQDNITNAVADARERTGEALARLDELLSAESERPAS